jgi:hypothetical protein
MVVDMKKDKNNDKKNGYVDMENKNKTENPQEPGDEKLLELRWKEFVKDTQTPRSKNKNDVKKEGKIAKKDSEKPAVNKPIPEPLPSEPSIKEASSDDEDGHVAKKTTEKKGDVTEMMETDVDKLYELTKEKGIIKIKEAAKILGIDTDQVEEWGRILEEHKLVRLRYPPVGEPVLILKTFTSDNKKIASLKERKKSKPAKKIFLINLIVLLAFAGFISFYTIRFQTIKLTYTQAYLAAAVIIIIGIVFVFWVVKKRRKNEKRGEGKTNGQSKQQRRN